jgi:hypothetical protein
METAAEKRMASGNPVQVRPFTIDFDLWQNCRSRGVSWADGPEARLVSKVSSLS